VRKLLQDAMRIAGSPVAAVRRPKDILPAISRAKLRTMIPADALEIGPFDVPFLSGPTVEYFDILDQAHLRQRAVELSRNPDGCPYVHYTGKLADIPRRFAAVFSAHAIEHQPDLIGHLEDVKRLLQPQGAYYLIIPDKRFCFDHYLPESTFDDVQEGRGRTRPTEQAIVAHRLSTTHNISPLHWLGIHGKPNNDTSAASADLSAWAKGEHIDVHQWIFTPESFRAIVERLGIFPAVTVHDTPFGDLEFAAVLSLSRDSMP
jgi:hypothetical protein